MKRLFVAAVLLAAFGCSSGEGPGDYVMDDTTAPDVASDVSGDTVDDVAHDTGADIVEDTAGIPPDTAPDAEVPSPVENGGVRAEQSGDALTLKNSLITVTFKLAAGYFDVTADNGPAVLMGAEARVVTTDGLTEATYGTLGRVATWDAQPVTDALGSGVDVILSVAADKARPAISLTLGLRNGSTSLLSRVDASWPAAAGTEVRVKYLSPLVADNRTTGALFLGADPSRHIVLDNGSDVYFDYQSRIFRMGYGDSFLFQPGTVSNWSMAVKDPDSPAALVAGFLSNDRAIGMVRLHHMARYSQKLDGRSSFHIFQGFGYYDPPRPLLPDPDDSGGLFIPGEPFYVDFDPPTPQQGLEDWASALAAHQGVTPKTDVPTGWNSWGGGGGSGGYSQDIFSQRILDNFDAMLSDMAPFGQKYFLIDDGWQKDHGDWVTNTTKFPDVEGQEFMRWFADRVRSNGLIPGLWIAPFWVKKSSDLYAAHPDWFADINDYGRLLIRPDDNAVLDLTHPDVKVWLHDLFHRIAHDWGYGWIKMDFAYWALFNTNMHDPTVTASEAYVNALRIIRDAIGPDTFFLGVAAVGPGLGILDGCRMTLDNYPHWGDTKQQSIKVTLATAAHRYYLNRAWVNHPDLLFFRPEPLGLTLAEARAWASFVAIYGGIIKNAEPYTDMHDHQEWLDILQPMIPVYPRTARPLDLFELSFPEKWVLPVERGDRSWHVVGLFNWGVNEDLAASTSMPEGAREKTLHWSDLDLNAQTGPLLLFNVWDRTCEWAGGPDWTMTAQPRTGTLLVVRQDVGRPQVVFTTRHVLGGAVEISDEQSESGSNRLEFTLSSPAGREVTIYIASPVAPVNVIQPADAAIASGPCENVWAITFTPTLDQTNVQMDFL